MKRPRPAPAASIPGLLDVATLATLAYLALRHELDPWLPLAYIFVSCGAFFRRRLADTAVRSAVVGLAATAIAVSPGGGDTRRHIIEVPLLTALGFLFAAFAERHARISRAVARDRSRLERMIDALPLATVAFDDRARVVTWNPAAEDLFGWSADDDVGSEQLLTPADAAPEAGAIVRRILAGEDVRGTEVEWRARDGRRLELAIFSAPLLPSSQVPGGFLLVYEEIGERKRAERERDLAQRQYRALIEALPLITYIDEVDANASNVYTSPQVAEVLGWTSEEWASDPLFFAKILHPDDRERVLAEVEHANATREPFQSEYRLMHRDGRALWFRDHSTIVEDASGRPFARGFLLDITEQKRLEEQLLQAQKMDAIGQFAGGIAHDFNNLLTGIVGYAALADDTLDEPMLRRALAGIKSAAAEATTLTSQLLTFTRRDVPARTPLDLNELVRGSADLLERLVREDVRVQLELAEDIPRVAGDTAQLRQIVLNLALNARDAMAEGGTLTIETATDGRDVVLRVHDTGRGMDAATRLRAFEPFFTTKPEGEGTGLGLSVVYGLAEALGGRVELESAPGEGTTVHVLLPPADATLEPAELDVPPEAESGARGVERVLVVEDREVVRELAREVLEAAGFDVAVARGGADALALVDRNGGFSLLLTDVVMPEMSGPELATRIRERDACLRVIYMSGYTDDVLDPAALAEPATGFLRKPFSIGELTTAVRELLDAPVEVAS